jgi:hypothetical protein
VLLDGMERGFIELMDYPDVVKAATAFMVKCKTSWMEYCYI